MNGNYNNKKVDGNSLNLRVQYKTIVSVYPSMLKIYKHSKLPNKTDRWRYQPV